jgi:hypothetical protein
MASAGVISLPAPEVSRRAEALAAGRQRLSGERPAGATLGAQPEHHWCLDFERLSAGRRHQPAVAPVTLDITALPIAGRAELGEAPEAPLDRRRMVTLQ